MGRTIDVLLLLALPASGKSELRRYLGSLDTELMRTDLGLGPLVQLDDYPYVHMMRRIDRELGVMGLGPVFFTSLHQPFIDLREWGTLIQLLNEDYAALGAPLEIRDSSGVWLLDRLDRARAKVGMDPATRDIPADRLGRLVETLEGEAESLRDDLSSALEAWTEESTVVIEFARGGPDGAAMPLVPPHGYSFSLAELSDDIKERASILYVWVTPEESRRKNAERAVPGPEGEASILFHSVPEEVMFLDYGTDDLLWLAGQYGGDAIEVEGRRIPMAVFDNRVDRTSFLRHDPDVWPAGEVAAVHETLKEALAHLAR